MSKVSQPLPAVPLPIGPLPHQPPSKLSGIQLPQETLAKVISFYKYKFDKVRSVIGPDVVKSHLKLLKAINTLFTSSLIPGGPITKAEIDARSPRVNLVVTKAVYRYNTWIHRYLRNRTNGSFPLASDELPPLDVLAVWVAHMLIPFPFKEDMIRRLPELHQIDQFPFAAMDKLVDVQTGEYQPSPTQRETWAKFVRLPFEPLAMNDTVNITCPRCCNVVKAPWIDSGSPIPADDGEGFGEAGFATTCSSCSLVITHDVLCTGKFLEDYERCCNSETEVFLETLLDRNGATDYEAARDLVRIVESALGPSEHGLGDRLSWSMEKLQDTLLSAADEDTGTQNRLKSLLHAYRGPFICLDEPDPDVPTLVHVLCKLMNFCNACNREGFLSSETLTGGQLDRTIENATISYKNYLCRLLVPEWRRGLRVPSQAADIVWHTHQLLGKQYRDHCEYTHGFLVNHVGTDQARDRPILWTDVLRA
ncbi:hypothetical protein FRB99_005250 [Tulasnella sp. 403]|nr:hypothetical protein FRB99_005250 [Tulasnella sp. 403]